MRQCLGAVVESIMAATPEATLPSRPSSRRQNGDESAPMSAASEFPGSCRGFGPPLCIAPDASGNGAAGGASIRRTRAMAPAAAYRLQHTVNGFIRIQRQERMRSIGVHEVHSKRVSDVYWCMTCGAGLAVSAVLHAHQTCRAARRDTLPAVNFVES